MIGKVPGLHVVSGNVFGGSQKLGRLQGPWGRDSLKVSLGMMSGVCSS